MGMVHTKKEDFISNFDLGVPVDLPKPGEEDVLILYSKTNAMPKSKLNSKSLSSSIDLMGTAEAVENCDYLNIILTNHDGSRNQCLALVPQYESYHIQKWMRIPPTGKRALDRNYPLTYVSRGHQSNGREQFMPPKEVDTRRNWDMLRNYLSSIDVVLNELKPIIEKISVKNTV